ncbi:TadE/TadG family type IV pilus assembly protein [Micromonospora solifontis]|uniref:Pilus assembly protein n=1 Tax=Micromonospora solifontis TaxID=2487138 RepID=A0ABX9WF03_9ACTN|nr:pilus assembly protein [Micromonospora sp. PPF5-17B]NES38252.1 pilus assembly protein [Micromonospora solifontis]NES56588.1 pilus assembly protein [Micromonospora sp. PPF5-6]RNL96437.1 pilus assembly protein [Micromonospora solifontis]
MRRAVRSDDGRAAFAVRPHRPARAARSGGLRPAVAAVRRRLAGDGTDRGANPVELAVVMPAILVLLFGSIQLAALFVARSTALHAAESGVDAQRVLAAPAGAGEARARRFLRATGDWLVGWDERGPRCVTTATEVTCTVTGRSLSVVPGVSFPVRQTAHGTVERWTTG